MGVCCLFSILGFYESGERWLFEKCGSAQQFNRAVVLNSFLCISVFHLMIFMRYSYLLGKSLNILPQGLDYLS